MKKYYEMCNKVRKEEERLHTDFMVKHRRHIRIMDIVLIAAIILNFSSLAMTNYMAMKEKPERVLMEINPRMAEIGGFEEHPESNSLIRLVLYQVVWWVVVFGVYVYYRGIIFTWGKLMFITLLMAYIAYMVGHSFFNDFGYYIGRLVFG